MITRVQIVNSWSDVDIMGNQKRVPRFQFQNKLLVPPAFQVIRHNFHYRTGTADLDITLLIFVSLLYESVTG